jgi:hypothetical protein
MADLKLIQAMLRNYACVMFDSGQRVMAGKVEAQAAALDGMVIVPREPSAAMLQYMDKGSAYQTWKNMLAAAQEQDHE